MDKNSLVTTLASYLPDLVLRRIAENPTPIKEPRDERRMGAALVADVTGFTAITERLAASGAVGAEQLTQLLNDYFGRVIEIVCAQGGDVVRFAGDALLIVWTADAPDEVALATKRAAQCALDLQRDLDGYKTSGGVPLALKIGIGSGEFANQIIGGVFDRWEFLVSGLAFVQAFSAIDQAQPGQVTVSLQAWSHLASHFQGEQLQMGAMRVTHGPDASEALTSVKVSTKAGVEVTPLMESALRSYIPATVTSRLTAGHEHWIGELRVVTVMFVNLPELNYATPLARAQQIMQYLQTELYRFEGSINKLNVDDKGTALLAALGLPPLSHEDDARRAVQAAMSMQGRLRELGLRSSMGLCTGRVFCGSFGSDLRREYTLLGDSVNLAARLMQTALGDIFCDEATYRMAQANISFECLSHVSLKGKSEPVTVFRPTAVKVGSATVRTTLVGRKSQREMLSQKVKGLARDHWTSIIVLEGDAGIGKSRLVTELLQVSEEAGLRRITGEGDSIEASTLYYAWRPIFEAILNVQAAGSDPLARQAHVLAELADEEEMLRLAPLLSDVISVDIPDNELTEHMTGQVRGDNTRTLLLKLIQRSAAQGPLLIILEDLHWLDSASWALTLLVARQVRPVLLVLVTRPIANPPSEFEAILHEEKATHIVLDRLSGAESEELVRHCLGVKSVSKPIMEFIDQKAEGHPLFTEELSYALRDGELIEIVEGQCRSAKTGVDFETLEFPDTLHGVITSRIDRLGPSEQLAVKVASVVGRHFPYRVLHDNYPILSERQKLRDHLAGPLQANLIGVEKPEPNITYLFRHIITQEVAYELLLFNHRQQLHRSLARWHEKHITDSISSYYPVIAHHWRGANQPAKAIVYLEKSGEQSLRSGAYGEAVGFIGDAVNLADRAGLKIRDGHRARWQRILGEAYLGLGKLSSSREHLERALELLGHAPPTGGVRLIARLIGLGVGQIFRRALFRRRDTVDTSQEAQTALEAARSYERLTEIYYLSSEKARLLHAVFATLKLAEKAGPSPELARAYATNCVTVGLAGIHVLARAYQREGPATARALKDPSALAWVLEVSSVYGIGAGRITESEVELEEAVDICEQLGDWQHWGENKAVLAQAAYFRGDFQQGQRLWTELYDAAAARGDQLQQAWGYNGRSEGLLKFGREGSAEQAVELLEKALVLFADNVDRISQIGSCGLMAQAQLRLRHYEAAREAIESGLKLARLLGSPTSYYSLGGYAGCTQAALAIWELNRPQGDPNLARRAKAACRAMDRYAGIFALGKPSALLCRGLYKWLSGRRTAAVRRWRKSIAAAEDLGMPYHAALTQLEWGRRLGANDPQREELLTAAQTAFEKMENGWELAQAQAALANEKASTGRQPAG
jgi:class 3 adenylate cyclase/tetratricopeptide (TPR) repeat protein